MAHFAKLDKDNNVIDLITVNNAVLLNKDGYEEEQLGINFCKSIFGEDTIWKQSSFSGKFRLRQAVIGGHYDDQNDIFYNKQPYPSWTLNKQTFEWEPPTPIPSIDKIYIWDEEKQKWNLA